MLGIALGHTHGGELLGICLTLHVVKATLSYCSVVCRLGELRWDRNDFYSRIGRLKRDTTFLQLEKPDG